ncbi:MAG: HesA/MoeB/ThiF family protein [Egibacteraceae bacterium]
MKVKQVELSQEEWGRFEWQIMIPGFGAQAQRKLKGASALVTRVGGLGSPAALNLAMAGIGKLILAHGGTVELFHMNRWILASYDAIERSCPAVLAAERIAALNPTVEIEVIEENATEQNVERMVERVDVVLDCPPTFEERHLLNAACVRLGKPMIEAAVYGTEGYLTTIIPGKTACIACLDVGPQDWRLPFPVLGAMACAIGSMAALEAIKVITGYGTPLLNTLLLLDGATGKTRYLKLDANPDCRLRCQTARTHTAGVAATKG